MNSNNKPTDTVQPQANEPTVEQVMSEGKTQPKRTRSPRQTKKVSTGNAEVSALKVKRSQIQQETQKALIAQTIQSGVSQVVSLEEIRKRTVEEAQLRFAVDEYQAVMSDANPIWGENVDIDFSKVFGGSPDIDCLLGESLPGDGILSLTAQYEIGE